MKKNGTARRQVCFSQQGTMRDGKAIETRRLLTAALAASDIYIYSYWADCYGSKFLESPGFGEPPFGGVSKMRRAEARDGTPSSRLRDEHIPG
jgi:hypothetical protein